MKKNHVGFSYCLVCGVDSGPPLTFFIWLVGGVLAASICVLIWAKLNGKFSSEDKTARIPLEVENAKQE